MTTSNPVFIGKLVAGGAVTLDLALTKENAVYNLTGKTVVSFPADWVVAGATLGSALSRPNWL